MDLSGYRLETLREDPDFVLYRARQHGIVAPILLLAPVSTKVEATTLWRLEHEYALSDQLDATWAAKPSALARHEGRTVLVLCDPGGQPLNRLLGKPLELAHFLNVAVCLATALRQVHARGLIHKDIKPANILVDEVGNVRLTGFGFATQMPRERQAIVAPEVIAGTPAYMAPEQTGRTNRSIDHRCDLYSLGVTLYEMLVGALPFTASKPIEWIYCHIARLAPPPSVRVESVPPALETMILKLLSKNAEERYQTAAGIEFDLRHCLSQLRAGRHIELFPLAARDLSDRLLIPEKLYGREAEIGVMVAAFDRVATLGRFEFILVSGTAGVGKTSVVNELQSTLHSARNQFAAGQFEKHKRHIPYATLTEAFQGPVRQILSQPDAELSRWRSSLQNAVGINARLMVDLFPELGLILGDQPPLRSVTPQEAKNRFHFVFRRFVEVFAQPEHPLVLFLDDLQWIDEASLELLGALVAEQEIPYLLLIGTYRINEFDSSQDLNRTLEVIGVGRSRLQEIPLAPLTPQDIEQLVADSLHADRASVRPLAECVFLKTEGNPLFAAQFLTALNVDGLLNFDTVARIWRWDVERIRTRQVTDNVAELMAGKLVRYEGTALRLIKEFACLANGARSTTLSMVLSVTVEEVDVAFREFVRAGLVNRMEGGYVFAHHGVREAAYALIPEAERASSHLKIGRAISEGIGQNELYDNIFEIVHQFNLGASLITSSEERQQLSEMNLIAGKRAEAAAAYDSGLTYLAAGCALLTTESWDQHYRTTFELELHRAECKFMAGELAFAEERLAMLSERSANLADLALILGKRAILYIYLGRFDRAIELSIDCLARMDVLLPLHPTDQIVEQEYRQLRKRIGGRSIDTLIDLPAMTDSYWHEVMGVLEGLLALAGAANPDLQHLAILRMVNISLDHGISNESSHAFANLGGFVLGWRVGSFADGRQFGQLALRAVERGFDRYAARVYSVISGTVGPWNYPLTECYGFAVRATDTDREQGGIIYSGFAWATGLAALLGTGKALAEVQQFAETGLAFSRTSKFPLLIECVNASLFLIRALRGMTSTFASFSGAELIEEEHERYLQGTPGLWHGLVRFRIRQLQLQFYSGNYAACLEIISKLDIDVGTLKVFEVTEYRFFAALALAVVLTDGSTETSEPHFSTLKSNHELLVEWAKRCPANFSHRACLVGAEVARLKGSELSAEHLYEEAIRLAREHGFLHDQALAFELGARFYAIRGFDLIAETYLRNARSCYLRWGADGKVRQLDRLHPHLTEESSPRPATTVTSGARFQNLDLEAVIEMYKAVSGEIVLERLIERLMVTVVEHAGAVRGLLLLPRDGEMPIVAEAITNHEAVTVNLRHQSYELAELPQSVLNYVTRTHDCIIIDDALQANPYSDDAYIRRARPRSILCLPLTKQRRLVGVLYLENDLSSHIFTQNRLSVLQLLASQAAISIENAELFLNIQKTQEHARRVGDELQRSFDMIPALAWRASAGGSIEIANKQWHDYTGISREAAHAGTWMRSFHPDDVGKVADKWQHLSKFCTSGEFEARMRRFDGEFRSFLVRVKPTHDEQGNIVNWHGTHTDIDDLKRAQDALRKSEADLAEGQRISHTGTWVWNAATDMVSWSEECARIFGFDSHERTVPYSSLLERIHPEDRSFTDAQHTRAMLAGGDHSFEHRIVLSDGTLRSVLSCGRLVRGTRDEVIEYVGTILDVTEQKRSEGQMREAQAALSRVGRLTALGELTASIAHEVNQPLMAIVTNAATCLQWLTEDQLNVEEARLAAKRIIRDGQRAGDVISSIRAMARKSPPQMAKLDLNGAILEVLSLTRNELDRHSIAAETELAADATPALGDCVQMQQVILNLIMNGIEAINAAQHEPRVLNIRSQREDLGHIWVTISDTGVGLAQTGTEKIFESFYTTKPDGIGIGLSICRSIIEAHRGRLWASPNLPYGTAFHFTLPMYQGEQSH